MPPSERSIRQGVIARWRSILVSPSVDASVDAMVDAMVDAYQADVAEPFGARNAFRLADRAEPRSVFFHLVQIRVEAFV